ncbi:MAG: hypothetical protein WCJ55_05025 [Chloroflexales bacterium]
MRHMRFGSFIGGAFGLSLGCLLVFGLLRWMGMPAGQLMDWIIGLATFWWLLVVVTIPWNIHFGARHVLVEAAESRGRGMAVDVAHVAYARRWVRWSLLGAIILHLASAGGLYGLAVSGVSAIGYLGSVAALLLTGLRPAVAGYAYVSERLRVIGEAVRYPREDVMTLRADLRAALDRLKAVERALDLEDASSLAAQHAAALGELRQGQDRLRLAQSELRETNAAEHARLAREAEQAVARISADGQVIDHVRELVRFFKSA